MPRGVTDYAWGVTMVLMSGDFDGDHVSARGPDGVLELNAPLVEPNAAGLADRVNDLLRGDRAKEATIIARLV
jgi:hypothetical protein